jgi:hypothetical protein
MSEIALPIWKRACRWQNDSEFCAWVERRHVRMILVLLAAIFALNVLSAVGSLVGLPR